MKNKSLWKRLFTGCGWLTAIAVLLVIVLVAWNWRQIRVWPSMMMDIMAEPEYSEGLNTPDEVLTYLQSYPDDVALVVYSVAPDGTPRADEAQIWHNAEQLMPLASTKKVLILAAYAQAVADGKLDPETAVKLSEWDHYHVPGTNGEAHIAALTELGIEVDEAGYALNPEAEVTLDEIAHAMIQFSDNAAPDYLLNLLGADAVEKVMVAAELTPQPILPHAGMMLTWQNHEQKTLSEDSLAELTAMDRDTYVETVWEMEDKFLNSEWGEEERAWRRKAKVPNLHRLEMAAANQLDTMGTAGTFAEVMAGVVSGTFISPEVSALMQRHLEWPMAFPVNQEEFTALGNKSGSLMGLLTGATYYVPKTGEFAGQPRVVVLFMQNMPFAAWARMSQNFAHQQLERELATNPDFVQQVSEALKTMVER